MKNTYVLFSPDMAIAYSHGNKSQTRRIMRPQPLLMPYGVYCSPYNNDFGKFTFWTHDHKMMNVVIGNIKGTCHFRCPYGIPGDQLTFLTTWKTLAKFDDYKPTELPKDVIFWSYFDMAIPKEGKLRPGRFMPKWMREQMPKAILQNVRGERIQDISSEDCKAEGISPVYSSISHIYPVGKSSVQLINDFSRLWNSIYGKTYPFSRNPWVFVLDWEKK